MVSPSLEEEGEASSAASTETPGARSGSSRPSFTDYWKRTKKAATRHITFVSSSHEQQIGPSSNNGRQQQRQQQHHQQEQEADLDSGKAKAQARRAQVRKAQIQHRQRKMNYTKQLEMDVAKLRDLIEHTERETLALKSENEAIWRRLATAQIPASFLSSLAAPPSTSAATTITPAAAAVTTAAHPSFSFSTADSAIGAPYHAPGYTVSLSVSEGLGTPSFQVTRTPTPTSLSPPRSRSRSGQAPNTAGASLGSATFLSEAQTDHAINFILGLEHICWDHFRPSYYTYNDYDPEAEGHGHALMASAIALQSAPPSAFEQITAVREQRQLHNGYDSGSRGGSSNGGVLASWEIPAGDLGLTLANLYGLASALNPSRVHRHGRSQSQSHTGDAQPASHRGHSQSVGVWDAGQQEEAEEELAPVQAWFEIARRYGGPTVTNALLMDAVRAELAAAVACLHFGAAVRRGLFEDVLLRVLGVPPLPPKTGYASGV
ncbi:hypothetical protein AAE478_000372 [Parahypoxylon ruwenzoriense]